MSATSDSRTIAVIGAGPAGLMAAEVISAAGLTVTVFDAMPSAGRKFLMAGRGGLNLTHSEPLPQFLPRYREAEALLASVIGGFTPEQLRHWCDQLGQPTFVGSSGRVFPTAMKASPLLRAWLRRLDRAGVRFAFRHRWTGWDDDGRLLFVTQDGACSIAADAIVLALGGASWPRLGADGSWTAILAGRDVAIAPLRPANCGVRVAWSDHVRDRFEGQPLKGIALSFSGRSVRGEAVITRTGLEGGAVYALSAEMRDALDRGDDVVVHIDLRPDQDAASLGRRLQAPRGKASMATHLRKAAQLSPVGIALLQEAAMAGSRPLAALPAHELAALIKAVPVRLTGTASIDRAISTAGGIRFVELDDHFMLRRLPGVFAAGEMLDWEAPTGGYLLQACFATGAAAGRGVLHWLGCHPGLAAPAAPPE